MKIKKISLITLCIILCISLISGCQPKTTTAPDIEETETEIQSEIIEEELEKEELDETPDSEFESQEEDKTETKTPISPTDSNQNEPKEQEVPKAKDEFVLKIEGSGIENEVSFTLDELKALKDSHFEDDFYSLNSYGTREHFHFKGIKMKALLDKAIIKSNAKSVKFVATDGYTQELTVELALKEDFIDQDNPDKKFPVIIAWHENGKDYDIKKGAPFRLVIGQKEVDDMNKPQWVSNIAKIIVD